MWIFIAPRPQIEHHVWVGHRSLAVLDAIGWPFLFAAVLYRQAWAFTLLESVLTWGLVLLALGRARRAWWFNGRYRFTTWIWGRRCAALLLLGALVRLCLAAA
jgi:hypothetical protein